MAHTGEGWWIEEIKAIRDLVVRDRQYKENFQLTVRHSLQVSYLSSNANIASLFGEREVDQIHDSFDPRYILLCSYDVVQFRR